MSRALDFQTEKYRAMDALADETEAFALYCMFMHSLRPFFAIDPDILPDALTPPWPKAKVIRAVDVLLERGFISEINAPSGAPTGIYRYRDALSLDDVCVMHVDEAWHVLYRNTDPGSVPLAVCDSNAAAWRWIDRNTGAGQADTDRHYRIRNSERFS